MRRPVKPHGRGDPAARRDLRATGDRGRRVARRPPCYPFGHRQRAAPQGALLRRVRRCVARADTSACHTRRRAQNATRSPCTLCCNTGPRSRSARRRPDPMTSVLVGSSGSVNQPPTARAPQRARPPGPAALLAPGTLLQTIHVRRRLNSVRLGAATVHMDWECWARVNQSRPRQLHALDVPQNSEPPETWCAKGRHLQRGACRDRVRHQVGWLRLPRGADRKENRRQTKSALQGERSAHRRQFGASVVRRK